MCASELLHTPAGSGSQLRCGAYCAGCCRWNPEGVAPPEEHGTSHFSIVDAERNAVSVTTSVRGTVHWYRQASALSPQLAARHNGPGCATSTAHHTELEAFTSCPSSIWDMPSSSLLYPVSVW